MLRALRKYGCAFALSTLLFPVICYARYGGKHPLTENIIDTVAILGLIALAIFMMADPKRRRNRFFKILVLAPAFFLSSCASLEQSVLFGAAMGGAAGTGVGVLAEPSLGSSLIGAGIGAVLGAGVGYLLHPGRGKSAEVPKGPRGKTIPESEIPSSIPLGGQLFKSGTACRRLALFRFPNRMRNY